MKRLLWIVAVAAVFVGCDVDSDNGTMSVSVIESFEIPKVGDAGYALGYTSDYLIFEYGYDEEYGSWSGFAVSNRNDMVSADWTNQYSVYNTDMASGEQFLLYYYDSYSEPKDILCRYVGDYTFKSVRVNVSTYTDLVVENGNGYARAFDDGDYLKVTFTALTEDRAEGESVDFYMVDYRDGKRYVADDWAYVDLSALNGALWGIRITMETTDVNEWGACTPLYVCLDDLTYTAEF